MLRKFYLAIVLFRFWLGRIWFDFSRPRDTARVLPETNVLEVTYVYGGKPHKLYVPWYPRPVFMVVSKVVTPYHELEQQPAVRYLVTPTDLKLPLDSAVTITKGGRVREWKDWNTSFS